MHDIFDCAKKKTKKNNNQKKKKKQKKKKIETKKQKETNAFTWLQMCFISDVRIICYNFLSDSHFQTNVIDDVENLFDYYLHITFSVLCTLTSCTHYTQIYSKLST